MNNNITHIKFYTYDDEDDNNNYIWLRIEFMYSMRYVCVQCILYAAIWPSELRVLLLIASIVARLPETNGKCMQFNSTYIEWIKIKTESSQHNYCIAVVVVGVVVVAVTITDNTHTLLITILYLHVSYAIPFFFTYISVFVFSLPWLHFISFGV